LSRFSAWLYKRSTGRITLLALLIFIAFTATVLPAQSARDESRSGGATSPDLSFYYSAGELYDMAQAYGEAGRAAYIRARYTFDIVWPAVYLFFLLASISWLFRRGLDPASPLVVFNIVPLFAVAMDLLENISTSIVMARYPDTTPVVAALAGPFTALKWTLVAASFVLLVAGLVAAARRYRA